LATGSVNRWRRLDLFVSADAYAGWPEGTLMEIKNVNDCSFGKEEMEFLIYLKSFRSRCD
jgi:hypothetical protein